MQMDDQRGRKEATVRVTCAYDPHYIKMPIISLGALLITIERSLENDSND